MMETKLKDSGIPWIGAIPEHWDASKIGQLYDNRYERVSDKDFEPLSVTMQGILPQLETAAKTDDGDNRKLVKKGDFAINSRSDRRGSCGISPQDGSVSLINLILAPRTSMNADYYNWLFHTSLFADEFYSWGHGIVADLWTTRWQEMKNIAIPVPPLEEQERIAAWLDVKCGDIDELIDVEQQMISDLEAYRQAVITEAVTRGLNLDIPTKSTSIHWLPTIPEHWEEKPFKEFFSTSKGLSITKADLTEKGVPVINYGQVHSKLNKGTAISEDIIKYVPESFLVSDKSALVNMGDFIFADTSEDVEGCGNCCYIDIDNQIFAGYHSIIARNKKFPSKYLAYLFLTKCWRTQIHAMVNGIKVFSIPQKLLSSTKIILPPISEQQEIAQYLDVKCAEIDELIKVKQEKVETLKQYRQSLIFEAVTGKTSIKNI